MDLEVAEDLIFDNQSIVNIPWDIDHQLGPAYDLQFDIDLFDFENLPASPYTTDFIGDSSLKEADDVLTTGVTEDSDDDEDDGYTSCYKTSEKLGVLQEIKSLIANENDPIGKFLRRQGITADKAVQMNILSRLREAPRKPRKKYGPRRWMSAQEKEEEIRTRNREHARATRARRRLFNEIANEIKNGKLTCEKTTRSEQTISTNQQRKPVTAYDCLRTFAPEFKWIMDSSPDFSGQAELPSDALSLIRLKISSLPTRGSSINDEAGNIESAEGFLQCRELLGDLLFQLRRDYVIFGKSFFKRQGDIVSASADDVQGFILKALPSRIRLELGSIDSRTSTGPISCTLTILLSADNPKYSVSRKIQRAVTIDCRKPIAMVHRVIEALEEVTIGCCVTDPHNCSMFRVIAALDYPSLKTNTLVALDHMLLRQFSCIY